MLAIPPTINRGTFALEIPAISRIPISSQVRPKPSVLEPLARPKPVMPTTQLSKSYSHTSCTISVEGQTLTPDDVAKLTSPVNCTIQLQIGGKSHEFSGDGELLNDLVTTVDRYLKYQLSAQSQGTFSGSVAIRPLNAVRHRITLRQGNGIGQADLTTTELYDLAESLGEVGQAIPHLARLKTATRTVVWYRQPVAAVAALAVVGVGVLGASLILTRPPTEELAENTARQEVTGLVESQLPTAAADSPPADSAPSVRRSLAEPDIPESEVADSLITEPSAPAPVIPVPEATESSVTDTLQSAPLPSTADGDDLSSEPSQAEPDDAGKAVEDADLGDLAALSQSDVPAPQEQPSQLSEQQFADPVAKLAISQQQLQAALATDWQAPESLTGPIEYNLTLTPDGTILTAVPVDERARELQPQTPFADIPATSDSEGVPARATLGADSTVSVTLSPQP